MTSEAAALVRGAVDLYVHATPDMLPRRGDDLDLARESAAAGLGAVLHRNHHSPTVERARLASNATGFRILGALLLNACVGGLNPWAVDHALLMGAAWIGLPTLSARASRTGMLGSSPNAAALLGPHAEALLYGPADLTVTDDDGTLRPDTLAVLRLVADADVALHLGSVSNAEQLAVARAAAELGHERLVITYPRFDDAELEEALAIPGLYFELCTLPIHPAGLGWDSGAARNVEFIRKVGVERVVVSSDGGMAGAPPPAELLAWALEQYSAAGLTLEELRALTHDNPRLLVPA